jgi:hypothetical protein
MIPRIEQADYVRDHIIHLRFRDGTQGQVDLSDDLNGPIFAPLKDVSYFRSFELHPELHTLVWANGADFAPEFLYDRLTVPA